jgi:hypothetical protein
MIGNYVIGGIFIVFVILLIAFLIRRNKKDLKKYKEQLNASEMKPEKHENTGEGM